MDRCYKASRFVLWDGANGGAKKFHKDPTVGPHSKV